VNLFDHKKAILLGFIRFQRMSDYFRDQAESYEPLACQFLAISSCGLAPDDYFERGEFVST
jgi:hypothetical protein